MAPLHRVTVRYSSEKALSSNAHLQSDLLSSVCAKLSEDSGWSVGAWSTCSGAALHTVPTSGSHNALNLCLKLPL